MNNQKVVSGQYGYVNRNGRLVPTTPPKATAKVVKNPQVDERYKPKMEKIYYATDERYNAAPQQKAKAQQPKQSYAEREVMRKSQNKAAKKERRKKGIKNLCLYLSLFMILSSAKQMPFNPKAKVTELAEKNSEHNYMDELFKSDATITIKSMKNGKDQKVQLEDAVDKLEDLSKVCTLISRLNLDDADYPELTDKEKKKAIALYEENGIEAIIDAYKDNRFNTIEKARAARQLLYIREYVGGDWLDANGLKVAEELLEKTIKTAAIENYGTFGASEYDVAQISEDSDYPFTVVLKDPVSGAADSVVFTPIFAGEYAQAMLMLRDLNETDNDKLTHEERLQKINHTLRLVRKCLGKEVEDVFGITYTKKVK